MERVSKIKDRLIRRLKKKADGGPKGGAVSSFTPSAANLISTPTTSAPASGRAKASPTTTIIAQSPPAQIVPPAPQPLNPTTASPGPTSAQPAASNATSSSHHIDPWTRAYEIF
ncbi:hypothetical protein QBC46DRAFT_39995 [Diplogelasinospora grovesii]|uniref:Uncharacterized protein n=1 Tax=Diplogelasinospora grovesii TaxID=303347 RepID=A0AAN6S7Y9_9PEZI|nr:hypothetical protein QBC46DRAFT_39995 [Diplogelasinospora grovesii]